VKHLFFGPEDVLSAFDVSRETLDRLKAYSNLLTRWNSRINLVSPDSINNLWGRHIADSAQLFRYVPQDSANLLDVGTGAGFPGMVLAIMGTKNVTLVESDQRKVAFLREVARVTGADVRLKVARVEQLAPFPAAVITARALAPLTKILELTAPFRGTATLSLFLKGQNIEGELTDAHKKWRMEVVRQPSLTDPAGAILALREVRRVRDDAD
jgi:16S rRNA (guanine527-N7)-methyltransferase